MKAKRLVERLLENEFDDLDDFDPQEINQDLYIPPPRHIEVVSSHGEFQIDWKGNVVVLHLTQPYEHEESAHLNRIKRFDLDEWRRYRRSRGEPTEPEGNLDILDLGYWMDDGTYEPPEWEWRREEEGQ